MLSCPGCALRIRPQISHALPLPQLLADKDGLAKELEAARGKLGEGEAALKAAQQETSALRLQVGRAAGRPALWAASAT